MSEGQTIVKTKSRKGEEKVYKATGKPWSPETKLIVLTNQETASGAEILAEALRENRKALLIGTKTEGKHTVEMIEKLPNDYVMKYSVLNLITPSGKPFTSEGLKPDYEVAEYKGDFFPQDFVKNFEEQLKKDTALKFAIELPLK